MKKLYRAGGVLILATFAFAGGAWAQAKTQTHPVIEHAIEAVGNLKGRLQAAPHDFGGHKQKAIDALTIAESELQQARNYVGK
jgi:hypothetical protein